MMAPTRRSSRFRPWWCCSALAIADRSTFSISRAAACGEYWRTDSASATLRPRITSATSRAFRGDTRMNRATALVSMLLERRRPFGVGAVRAEGARRRELAELVPDHVLGHVHGDELPTVVHCQGVTDELRADRRPPRPGLDDLLLPRCVDLLDFVQEVLIDERALADRASHARLLLPPPRHDVPVGRLAPPGLGALGRLAPGRHRMVPLATALAASHRVIHRTHRHAADGRPDPQPAAPPRLPDGDVLV